MSTGTAHIWQRDDHGAIDFMAADDDQHNGPLCTRCGETFCVHCAEIRLRSHGGPSITELLNEKDCD